MADDRDPFVELRRPIEPVQPRPGFANALRRRLMEVLSMTETTTIDHGSLGLVHLAVRDADRAMDFFGRLFGWVGERFVSDHVSYYTLNTVVTVRLVGDPDAAPVRPNYQVSDVGAAVDAVVAAGGRVTECDVAPDGGGWAYAEDRAGVPIVLFRPQNHPHAVSDAPVSGDVGLVFVREDAADAAGFYGSVLGWELRRTGGHYYDTVDRVGVFEERPALGVDAPPSVSLFVEVAALRPAVARVEELGGRAEPVPDATNMGPYFGILCTDDQGTEFGVLSVALD
jgi:predicted enzyme related to lactoylglutathione lyase